VSDCRIVICDDQQPYRELLKVLLGPEVGFEVVGEAVNGSDAIDVVRRLQPDVLILDVAMPVMDGIEALPHIREVAPKTGVLVLTGLSSAGIRQRALDAGARLVVEKGTDADALAEHVREACAT
jgi:DNA-binding NarL/FixJ family response regulator